MSDFSDTKSVMDAGVYIAKIKELYPDDDTADIYVYNDQSGNFGPEEKSGVIFYFRCDSERELRSNGAIEGGSAAFSVGDAVYVVSVGDTEKITGRLLGLKPCNPTVQFIYKDEWYSVGIDVNNNQVIGFNKVNKFKNFLNDVVDGMDYSAGEGIPIADAYISRHEYEVYDHEVYHNVKNGVGYNRDRAYKIRQSGTMLSPHGKRIHIMEGCAHDVTDDFSETPYTDTDNPGYTYGVTCGEWKFASSWSDISNEIPDGYTPQSSKYPDFSQGWNSSDCQVINWQAHYYTSYGAYNIWHLLTNNISCFNTRAWDDENTKLYAKPTTGNTVGYIHFEGIGTFPYYGSFTYQKEHVDGEDGFSLNVFLDGEYYRTCFWYEGSLLHIRIYPLHRGYYSIWDGDMHEGLTYHDRTFEYANGVYTLKEEKRHYREEYARAGQMPMLAWMGDWKYGFVDWTKYVGTQIFNNIVPYFSINPEGESVEEQKYAYWSNGVGSSGDEQLLVGTNVTWSDGSSAVVEGGQFGSPALDIDILDTGNTLEGSSLYSTYRMKDVMYSFIDRDTFQANIVAEDDSIKFYLKSKEVNQWVNETDIFVDLVVDSLGLVKPEDIDEVIPDFSQEPDPAYAREVWIRENVFNCKYFNAFVSY